MFYFKACPKCRGDVHLEEDVYGKFLKCFQCSRIVDLVQNQPGVAEEKLEQPAELVA